MTPATAARFLATESGNLVIEMLDEDGETITECTLSREDALRFVEAASEALGLARDPSRATTQERGHA